VKQSMLVVALLALCAPASAQFSGLDQGLKKIQ
jgi:hypothetical protein